MVTDKGGHIMAQIHGLSFKNMKQRRGHEGEELFSADLMYKKEIVGSVEELDMGGGLNINASDEWVKLFTTKYKCDLEEVIYDLQLLNWRQSIYKKIVKKGYDNAVFIAREGWSAYQDTVLMMSSFTPLSCIPQAVLDELKQNPKYAHLTIDMIKIYSRPQDFIKK